MTCKHCHTDIHEATWDTPFVHDATGNALCDVHSISDVFSHRHFMNRAEAEPEEDAPVFAEANLTWYLFSQN